MQWSRLAFTESEDLSSMPPEVQDTVAKFDEQLGW